VYTTWTQHLKTEEEKTNFRRQIMSASPVLDRLRDIIKSEQDAVEMSTMDIKSFDHPNWPYFRASKDGYKTACEFLRKLVDIDKQVVPKETNEQST
jgi:hypothetical protein